MASELVGRTQTQLQAPLGQHRLETRPLISRAPLLLQLVSIASLARSELLGWAGRWLGTFRLKNSPELIMASQSFHGRPYVPVPRS